MRRLQLPAMVLVAAAVIVFAVDASVAEQLPRPSVTTAPDKPVTDFDGNTYRTVRIGRQVWMAENLRSTHYADGALVSYFEYGQKPEDVKTYGRLYSSGAVTRGAASSNTVPSRVQGIAPQGWHVPSRAEWEQLAAALGGPDVAGARLKEAGTAHWMAPNTGATNDSLFTALPAGMHDFTGIFQWVGERAVFATSTANRDRGGATAVMLQSSGTSLTVGNFHPDDAYSVRCVRDDQTE